MNNSLKSLNKSKNNKKYIKVRKIDLLIKSLKKLDHFFFKIKEGKVNL